MTLFLIIISSSFTVSFDTRW